MAAGQFKNGSVKGQPKRKCVACGFQPVGEDKRGKPEEARHFGVLLHSHGLSLNAVGKAYDRDSDRLIDGERGNRDAATLRCLLERLSLLFRTDDLAAYGVRRLHHKEMLNAAIALFAAIHVNKTGPPEISLFG